MTWKEGFLLTSEARYGAVLRTVCLSENEKLKSSMPVLHVDTLTFKDFKILYRERNLLCVHELMVQCHVDVSFPKIRNKNNIVVVKVFFIKKPLTPNAPAIKMSP